MSNFIESEIIFTSPDTMKEIPEVTLPEKIVTLPVDKEGAFRQHLENLRAKPPIMLLLFVFVIIIAVAFGIFIKSGPKNLSDYIA